MKNTTKKMNPNLLMGTTVLLLSMSIAQPLLSHADINTWTGGAGNWADGGNWSLGHAPQATDDAALTPSANITVNYNALDNPQLNSLTVDGVSGITLSQPSGNLTAYRAYVGYSDSGSIYQTGGNTLINGDPNEYEQGNLILGYNNGSNGTYDLLGGSLSAFQVTIGRSVRGDIVGPLNGSTGTFTQGSNSTLTIGQDLVLGQGDGSTGTYTLNNGTINGGRDEYIGGQGTGIFIQNGGVNTASHILDVGFGATTQGGSGSYTLNSGDVNSAYLLVGSGGGVGTFTQNGGTVSVNLPPGPSDPVTNNLRVGNTTGSTGTFTLNQGNLTVGNATTDNGLETIGRQSGSVGTFNQTGGTHTLNGVMIIGEVEGSTGAYNLSGGTLTVSGGATPSAEVLQYQGALLNNGTFNVSNNASATFTGTSTNNGIINVTNAFLTFDGNFFNNGAYISDPSINMFKDLTVGATGYLQGEAGDQFIISGDFINNSTSTLWDTTEALLGFRSGGAHTVSGDSSWGTLQIIDSLTLSGTGSLFFHSLEITSGSSFTVSGLTLYSDNPEYIGQSIGGVIVQAQAPVPEPNTLLLFATGLAGLAAIGRRRQK